MSRYLDAIRDAIDYTKKTNEILESELSFDDKLTYIEKILERRERTLEVLKQTTAEETDGSRRLLKVLKKLDDKNGELMQNLLDDKWQEIEDVRLQKIDIVKQGKMQKTYMTPISEVGYYINNMK